MTKVANYDHGSRRRVFNIVAGAPSCGGCRARDKRVTAAVYGIYKVPFVGCHRSNTDSAGGLQQSMDDGDWTLVTYLIIHLAAGNWQRCHHWVRQETDCAWLRAHILVLNRFTAPVVPPKVGLR